MIFNFQTIKPFLQKHGPTILTGLAMFGVVATGYLTHRADKKVISEACEAILFTDDADIPIEETVGRCMKKNWKNYIPPVVTGLATMGCMLGSNQWHLSKEGTLAAAALMYKTSGEELEKALKEKFGDEEVKKMKQEIAEAKADRDRPPWEEMKPGRITFYEPYSKQYIQATQQELLWAELTANKILQQSNRCTMNDLLSCYPHAKKMRGGDNIGWGLYEDWFCESASYAPSGPWINFTPQYQTNANGDTYFVMDYEINPMELSKD